MLLVATLSALLACGGVLRLNAEALRGTSGQGRLVKAADGHFWAQAEVDGSPVRFLVDTGSSAVALTPADASRIGIDVSHLVYDRPVFTAAGGDEKAAAVVLDHVAISGARVERVSALIMRSGLPTSLLGMSYLGRLSSFSATPEALTLNR